MPKLQEVKGKFTLTVPSSTISIKGWKKGDNIEFIEMVTDSLDPKAPGRKELQTVLIKTKGDSK
jgi:hypothetical protein